MIWISAYIVRINLIIIILVTIYWWVSVNFVIESFNKKMPCKTLGKIFKGLSFSEIVSLTQTDATLTRQMIRAGIPIPLHVEICLQYRYLLSIYASDMDYTEGTRKRTLITRKLTFTGPRQRMFLKSRFWSFYFFIGHYPIANCVLQ